MYMHYNSKKLFFKHASDSGYTKNSGKRSFLMILGILLILIILFFCINFAVILKTNVSLKTISSVNSQNIRQSASMNEQTIFDGTTFYRITLESYHQRSMVGFWIYPNAIPSVQTIHFASVKDISDVLFYKASIFLNAWNKNICIEATSQSINRQVCSTPDSIKMDTWNHVIFEFAEMSNPISQVNIYINGVINKANEILPRFYRKLLVLVGGSVESQDNFKGMISTLVFTNLNNNYDANYAKELAAHINALPQSIKFDRVHFRTAKGEPQQPQVQTKSKVATVEVKKEEEGNTFVRNFYEEYRHRPDFYQADTKLRATYPSPPENEDDWCLNVPPSEIPELNKPLEEFINNLLEESNNRNIRYGTFEYSVPDHVKADYHNLNEYRAHHVRNAFCFAWAGYREKAWGMDEIQPISGMGNNNWGGVGITILDSIDSLLLLGLKKEASKARDFVETVNFDLNRMSSFFETTIRVLGGLLSAYDLTKDALYLQKAEDIATRLLPAFDTPAGYPKGSINFHTGNSFNPNWTGQRSLLAEIGTVSLEFQQLANFTGKAIYQEKINKLYTSLEKSPTWDGLLSSFMNVNNGNNEGGSYSLSGMSDSYYEYLLKMWIQSGKKDERARTMYVNAMEGVTKHLLARGSSGLLYLGETYGQQLGNNMGHLACFAGGMLALGVLHEVNPATAERDLANAKALGYTCYQMYMSTATGIGGESMAMAGKKPEVVNQAPYYILRPEAIETLYYLNQITGDPIYREWGWKMWKNIEKHCKTQYGYAHLKNVNVATSIEDRAESFFFAETAKYLYLLFKDDKVVDLTKKVFNTEAHPFTVLG